MSLSLELLDNLGSLDHEFTSGESNSLSSASDDSSVGSSEDSASSSISVESLDNRSLETPADSLSKLSESVKGASLTSLSLELLDLSESLEFTTP